MAVPKIFSLALSAILVTVMVGIGLSVTTGDLRKTFSKPKALIVALICQSLILPMLAFWFCAVFSLPQEFKIGLILLAISPGGPSSNLYSLLAKGDVALNLAITAINSFLSAITIPIYLTAALYYFGSTKENFDFGYDEFIKVISFVVFPAGFGMALASVTPTFAAKLASPLKLFAAGCLGLTVAAIVWMNFETLISHLRLYGVLILAFNILSLGLGYGIARMLKISRSQAVAISFEIGIHNGSLALFIAGSILRIQSYAIVPAIYSVLMYFTAAALCALFLRNARPVR